MRKYRIYLLNDLPRLPYNNHAFAFTDWAVFAASGVDVVAFACACACARQLASCACACWCVFPLQHTDAIVLHIISTAIMLTIIPAARKLAIAIIRIRTIARRIRYI